MSSEKNHGRQQGGIRQLCDLNLKNRAGTRSARARRASFTNTINHAPLQAMSGITMPTKPLTIIVCCPAKRRCRMGAAPTHIDILSQRPAAGAFLAACSVKGNIKHHLIIDHLVKARQAQVKAYDHAMPDVRGNVSGQKNEVYQQQNRRLGLPSVLEHEDVVRCQEITTTPTPKIIRNVNGIRMKS